MSYRKTMQFKIVRADLESRDAEQVDFNKKQRETKEIFPMVGLVVMWFGSKMYNRVVKAYKNKTNAKVLAEYVEYLITQATLLDRNSVSPRDLSFLRKYVMSDLSDDVCVELAREHNITVPRVRQAISRAACKVENVAGMQLKKIVENYIYGSVNVIVAEMPKNWQKTFMFQKRQNIADGNTDEFNAAGQWLMKNFFGRTMN